MSSREFPFPVRGFLFDLDGTLTDTEPLHHRSTNQVLATFGAHLDEAEYEAFIGWGEEAYWEALRKRFQIELPWSLLAEQRTEAYLQTANAQGAPLQPGVLELLARLAVADMPMAIASASPRRQIEVTMRASGLDAHFAHFVSGHDDVARSKPAPDVFIEAAARLGVSPEECIAVEDSPNGARSARDAGAFVVLVSARPDPSADLVVPSLLLLLQRLESILP